jgi:hypothetical protein
MEISVYDVDVDYYSNKHDYDYYSDIRRQNH